ncbi:MAG: hypothetical protein JXR18_09740 [Neptuniibacter sp.]
MTYILNTFVFLSLIVTSIAYSANDSGNMKNQILPENFIGKMLVSVSDADMIGSAYVDGMLGMREGRDAISVIPLGKPIRELKAHETEVSNSVAGPAIAVTVTPDGNYAFVVESFKARPEGPWENQKFSDLPIGNTITLVDLTKPTNPKILQKLTIADRPDAVSISAKGDLVAVTFNPNGGGTKHPLAIIPFNEGQLGRPTYPEVPRLPKGNRLMQAEWHPTKPVLALVDNTDAVVSFVNVKKENDDYQLKPWGNKVKIGKSPYMARFTPDGRYLISNNLYWGVDVQGKWVEAPRGDVVSIRLNAGKQKNGRPRHALVSRAMTSVGPEGLAISPNGLMVVTANVERSFLPYEDKRLTPFSSITLLKLNPQTGQLTRVSDYAFDGILTEAIAFDASNQYLAVTSFDHFDDQVTGGSIDFWRVTSDPLIPGSILVKTNSSIPVSRGIHSMVLVK